MNNVMVERRMKTLPNQKPWMTNEVKRLLRTRNTVFRSGDKEHYSSARADLKRRIKEAKEACKKTVEVHLTNNDPCRVWQGIQQPTNYKGNTVNSIIHADASLAEELNHFFARFEADRPLTDHLYQLLPTTLSPYRNNKRDCAADS